MAFNYLKVRPGQRATSFWANSVIEALNMLYDLTGGAVKYSDLQALGYDIIPDKDNLRKLGDPSRAWKEVNAHVGNFLDEAYVQGRRVLKDGDPITLYDIQEPAKTKITESIDNAKVTTYTKEVRDRFLSISIDAYGNVGVVISEPTDEYGRVRTSLEDLFKPVGSKVKLTAVENTYGASVSIKSDGRPNINLYYSLGGAGDIYVEVSLDGVNWRVLDTISLTASGEGIRTYTGVAYPYVRARTPTTGIDVELELVASR